MFVEHQNVYMRTNIKRKLIFYIKKTDTVFFKNISSFINKNEMKRNKKKSEITNLHPICFKMCFNIKPLKHFIEINILLPSTNKKKISVD